VARRVCIVWLLWFYALQAAFEIISIAPSVIAPGGSISITANGSNPAAFPETGKIRSALNYSKLYGIKNLEAWDADLQIKVRSQNGLRLRLMALGNSVYQERTLSLAYGRRMTQIVACGATINYYDLIIPNHLQTGVVGLDCGMKFFPDTALAFTLLMKNINVPKICSGREDLPQIFAFGWQWRPVRRGELSGEICKDTRRPFVFRSGLRVEVGPGWALLLGVQLNPDRLSGGFELTWRRIEMAFTVQHHPTLPLTFYYGCGFNL